MVPETMASRRSAKTAPAGQGPRFGEEAGMGAPAGKPLNEFLTEVKAPEG